MRYILFLIAFVALSSCSSYHSSLRYSKKNNKSKVEETEINKHLGEDLNSLLFGSDTDNNVISKNAKHEPIELTKNNNSRIKRRTTNSLEPSDGHTLIDRTENEKFKHNEPESDQGQKKTGKSGRTYKGLAITGFIMTVLFFIPFSSMVGFIINIIAIVLISRNSIDKSARAWSIIGLVLCILAVPLNYFLSAYSF